MFIERLTGRSRLSVSGRVALFAAIAGALQVGVGTVLAADSSNDSGGLQEVVVTAQRTETSLQKTPVAITAFSASELKDLGATSLLDISAFTPNLQVSARSGSASEGGFAIRGMGINSSAPSASPAVGIYVDDVYFPSQVGNLLSLFDVAQVEVLRGPQGTLFGRNTIAGAVQFTTVKPNTDRVSGFVEATGGNLGQADFTGAVNLPLTSTLAVRLSLGSNQRDGYVHDVLNDVDRGSDHNKEGRLQVLWTPTDKLSVFVKAESVEQKSNGRPITLLGVNPNSFLVMLAGFTGALAPPYTPYTASLVSSGRYELAGFNSPEYFNFRFTSAQSTIAYKFTDNVTLTSITAFSESINDGAIDADDTPANILADNTGNQRTGLLTEELRLAGRSFGDRFNWTAGAYYYDQNTDIADGTFGIGLSPPTPSPPYSDLETKAWALYGQATYNLTASLSGTVGLRYSSETANAATLPPYPAPIPGTFCGPGYAACGITTGTAGDTFTDTSPYIGLNYQLTPDVMIYAKASKGFRAGGYQWLNPVSGLIPYNEETAWTYEIGSRMEFMDKRLRVNPTVFYTDWKNIQFNAEDAIGEILTENAGDAIIRGAELEMQFIPARQWLLNASVSYLDGYYTRVDPGVAFETTSEGPQVNLTLNTPMQQSPKFKYTGGVEYTLPLAIPGRIVANVNYAWVDTVRAQVTNSDTVQLPSYGLLNAQIQYITADDHWRFSVFSNNLTNKYYDIGGVDELNGPGAVEVEPGLPREYGGSVRYEF